MMNLQKELKLITPVFPVLSWWETMYLLARVANGLATFLIAKVCVYH